MKQAEYKWERVKTQKKLLQNIQSVFLDERAIAIYQFGSFAKGTADELSDMDLWFTFRDDDIDAIVKQRDELFSKPGEVVIKYEPPQNAPLGGKYSLVIHKIDGDLYHVDYYLSALSKTNIRTDAILICGDDSLPRGEWILDSKQPFLNTRSSKIDSFICMSFVGIKYVVRNGRHFMDFLVGRYNSNKAEHFPGLQEVDNNYSLASIAFMLDEHFQFADEKQRNAIREVKRYLNRVAQSYGLAGGTFGTRD